MQQYDNKTCAGFAFSTQGMAIPGCTNNGTTSSKGMVSGCVRTATFAPFAWVLLGGAVFSKLVL